MNFIKQVKISREDFENLKRMKLKNKIITIIVLVILIIMIFNMFSDNKKVGNTIGNIRNYGYATQSGKWLYFLSPNEDSTQMGIFKMKAGDEKQKSKKQLVMDEWDVLSLNVSGNYLYFIGISSNAYSDEDLVDNKIYRMKTNGKNLEVINDNEFDNDCYEIYVIKNSIYYIGTDYNIYKMSLDGKKKELVLENGTGYLGMTDKYILYNVENEAGDDYVTHIANIKGRKSRAVIEDTRLYSVNIEGNYIYYTDKEKNICSVKVDGTKQKIIYETDAYNMNMDEKYIYYLNYEETENGNGPVCIFKIKKDGSQKEPEIIKKMEEYSSFIDVVGDWIIYMDSSETEGFINLLKTNGKKEMKVYTINFEDVFEEELENSSETEE